MTLSWRQIYELQGNLADNPLDHYENIMATNATGVLYHTKAAVRVMREQEALVVQGEDRARIIGRGAIVNVASVAGLSASPGSVEYTASKFAVIGITRTAGEFPGFHACLVNAIQEVQLGLVDFQIS